MPEERRVAPILKIRQNRPRAVTYTKPRLDCCRAASDNLCMALRARWSSDAGAAAAVQLDCDVEARVRDDALRRVVANMAPLPLLLLPLTALVAYLMRGELEPTRVGLWLASAAVATTLVILVCSRFRRRLEIDRPATVLAGTALASVATVAGVSPWVGAPNAIDIVMMFSLFPAVSCAVGTIVCAGRRDMFAAYSIPLTISAAIGMASTGDGRMQALGLMFAFYSASQVALHHTISRSLLASLRLQITSQALAVRMATDQIALTGAVDQLSTTNDQLSYLAAHDPLTGLLNRRGTIDRIDGLLDPPDSQAGVPEMISLLFCDLDRFKAINDLLGHRGGDQFISVLADRIRRSIEPGCLAGRIGGDEFVVVLPGHDIASAAAVASRLVGVLSQPVHAEGRSVPASVSIGVATAPDHGLTTSDLLRSANAALYCAKNAGRNRVELFDGDMKLALEAGVEAEQSLRRAIDDGEILPFFQPEVDAATGRVVGAELLARWLRPDGTVTNANEFISLARTAGLLERLTEKVFAVARPDIRRLASFGLPDGFRFRVNLAPSSTDRSWRINPIDELVRGIDPSLITVDVHESSVAADLPAAASTLAGFRARGGRVCLDDFARGVSSLSLLRKLPIDEVRVDRQAIDTITTHPHDRAIVRSIIAVVREIGLSVTAEGVETGAQADALIALGCVRQQGHLYSRALSAAQLESYLIEHQAERYMSAANPPDPWATDELS